MNQEISDNNMEPKTGNIQTKKSTKVMPLEIPMSKWDIPYESPMDSARGVISRRNLEPFRPLSVSELLTVGPKSPQLLRIISKSNNSSSPISPKHTSHASPFSPDQAQNSSGGTMRFKCVCGSTFEKKDDFYDHYSNECVSNFNVCKICDRGFTRKQDLKYHMSSHLIQTVTCDGCGFKFSRQQALNRHKHHCKNM
jgi:hypothetical protein